jgi:hypothetical protein
VKISKHRSLVALAGATLLASLLLAVPAASAADTEFRFVTQPADAESGATITSTDFVSGTSFVQVELVDTATNARVTNSKLVVTFNLATGTLDGKTAATGSLSVTPQPLVDGVATFGTGTLSIGTPNEHEFTRYALIPTNTKGPKIPGETSNGFNIWEDGDTCAGGGDACTAVLRGDKPQGGEDTYTLQTAGTLGASELPKNVLPGFSCAGQRLIFASSVFENATQDPPTGPVFLTSHITKADFRSAGTNFGQAHVEWCIALDNPGPWNFTQQDTNNDGDLDLYVGFAGRCPAQSPASMAPCIASQSSDGAGGSITTGYLPGGDPPRRT